MTLPGSSLLFDVEQRVHHAGAASCTVPVLYRATTVFGALFTIEPSVAASAFDGLSIEPWPLAAGVPALIVALEHHGSTAGPYSALAVAILARRHGFSAPLLRFLLDMRALEEQALWLTALGSTGGSARESGRAIWGLPHAPTDLRVALGDEAEARVPGEITLRCERPRGPAIPCPPLIVFGARDGRLWRTIAEAEGSLRVDMGARARLEVHGDGPIASAALALGLDRARPRLSFRADRVRARLPLPGDTGPLMAAPG